MPAGLDWWERRPALDPIRYGALRVLDDAAYCAGLWVGCLVEGTVGPLLPDLTGLGVPAPVRRLLRGVTDVEVSDPGPFHDPGSWDWSDWSKVFDPTLLPW